VYFFLFHFIAIQKISVCYYCNVCLYVLGFLQDTTLNCTMDVWNMFSFLHFLLNVTMHPFPSKGHCSLCHTSYMWYLWTSIKLFGIDRSRIWKTSVLSLSQFVFSWNMCLSYVLTSLFISHIYVIVLYCVWCQSISMLITEFTHCWDDNAYWSTCLLLFGFSFLN